MTELHTLQDEAAAPRWSQSYLATPVLQMLGPPRGPILDLGCGNGSLARHLASHGHDVYGVDVSAHDVSVAVALAPGRFHVMDVETGELPTPLRHMKFSTAISTEVVEHLYHPASLPRLARRVLAPDGELILSTPYHGYLKNLALALTGRMDSHFTALWDGGHIKFFSRQTLTTLLESNEFEVIDFKGAGRLPWLWKSMLLKARLR